MDLNALINQLTPLYRNGDLILVALKHDAAGFSKKDILVVEIHIRYLTLYKMPKSLKRKLSNEAYAPIDKNQQKEVLKSFEKFDLESIKSIIDYLENPSEEARWSII